MKKILFISIVCVLSLSTHGQMGVAKIKYQEAEEAYTSNNFALCLQKLNEVVEILKETNPRVQYLRITCFAKIVEKDPISNFAYLLQLNEYCKSYLNDYDKIPDLEDKYLNVFKISELMKNYPKNEEEYQQVLTLRKRGRIYRYQTDSLNFKKAEDLFTQAYKKGDMRSLVELANIYRNGGYGVSIDIPRMYRCYQELADHDIAEGNYYIGLAYLYGLNNYQLNSDKAIPMIKEAADKRFLPAMVLYGIMEFCSYQKRKKEADKTEVANRIAASESRLMDALNAGGSTPEFYYYIGKAYSLGVISPGVNQEKALEYFKKSADLGDPKGKNALGFYYMNGLGGLTKDANKALELFTYAANRLLAASEYNLYTLYLYGAPGIEKNTKLQQYWHDRYLVNTNKSIDQLPTNTTNEIY